MLDDIVEGIIRVMQGVSEKENGEDGLPILSHSIYNIGNSNPENLMEFILHIGGGTDQGGNTPA